MWRRTERAFLAVAALALIAGADTSTTLAVVGYNDMDEMLAALTARYAVLHPGTRFTLDLKSTRSAPAALASGRADLAPMGAAMTAEDLARFGAAPPVAIRVAHDSLAPGALSSPTGVVVGRDAPLRSIRLDLLGRLLTTDPATPWRWRDLGARGAGADRSVHLVGLGPSTAIGRFVLARLGATRFAGGYRGLPQSREVAAAVAADPDAIGIANLNHVGPGLRALDLIDGHGRRHAPTARTIVAGLYPLDRSLLIYGRRGADGRVEAAPRAFLRFMLSDEGQRLIARGGKGYLPLNLAERAAERAKLDRTAPDDASRHGSVI